eukprot:Sdes_comp17624_c0_seq1m6887
MNDSSLFPPAEKTSEIFQLSSDSELRFEVDRNETCVLKLCQGTAEIFGSELAPGKEYKFTHCKLAVFTYHSAKLQLAGKYSSAYTSKETPMITYLNTHIALEGLRTLAKDRSQDGPRVMLVGASDVGKSSLAMILANYAVRHSRQPILADLDIGQGSITIPTMISAVSLQRPIEVQQDFLASASLVYCYGHLSPSENPELYTHVCARLAAVMRQRFQTHPETRASGCIINTCGWIDGVGYSLIEKLIEIFQVNVLCVLDSEKLFNDLKVFTKTLASSSPVRLIRLQKSAGVVIRSKQFRRFTRDDRIRSYFYGFHQELNPHSVIVKFDRVDIFTIGAPSAPSSCLPLGFIAENNAAKHVAVLPSESLLHSILAVSACESLKNSTHADHADSLALSDPSSQSQKQH